MKLWMDSFFKKLSVRMYNRRDEKLQEVSLVLQQVVHQAITEGHHIV